MSRSGGRYDDKQRCGVSWNYIAFLRYLLQQLPITKNSIQISIFNNVRD